MPEAPLTSDRPEITDARVARDSVEGAPLTCGQEISTVTETWAERELAQILVMLSLISGFLVSCAPTFISIVVARFFFGSGESDIAVNIGAMASFIVLSWFVIRFGFPVALGWHRNSSIFFGLRRDGQSAKRLRSLIQERYQILLSDLAAILKIGSNA